MEREVEYKSKSVKIGLAIIIFLYILFIIKVAFFKESALFNKHILSYRKGYIFNLSPFDSIEKILHDKKGIWYIIENIFGNIYLFIPIGIFLPLLKKNISYIKVILTGILVSVSIETIQYIFIIGNTDIDDVILNTIGTVIGLSIFILLKSFTNNEYKLKVISLVLIIMMGIGCMTAIVKTRSDIFYPPKHNKTSLIHNTKSNK